MHERLADLLNIHLLSDLAGCAGQVMVELGRAETFLSRCSRNQQGKLHFTTIVLIMICIYWLIIWISVIRVLLQCIAIWKTLVKSVIRFSNLRKCLVIKEIILG